MAGAMTPEILVDFTLPTGCFVSGRVLSPEQTRFLALHARRFVTTWRWYFGGTQLRASTDDGHTATLALQDFASLVDLGLVEQVGIAGVRLTEAGQAVAREVSKYAVALFARVKSMDQESRASDALNAAQRAFDDAVAEMKKAAPDGSHWNKHER